MINKPKPDFNALEFKYSEQLKINSETKNLNQDELILYFKHSTENGYFSTLIKKVKEQENVYKP